MHTLVEINDDIRDFVEKVRFALEQPDVKSSYVSFHDFPSGSCSDASILLGKLLIAHGFEDFKVVNTDPFELPSHSWLQNEHWIIDITADQFATWPKQNLIINKYPYPNQYAAFEITSEIPASAKSFPFGALKAFKLIQDRLKNNPTQNV